MAGRELTAARSRTRKAPVERLVGQRVDAVEARAKHLLVRFSSGAVLHTHMRMTGAWHVYAQGDRWRKPAWQAAVVLEAGDRVAVCFDAPVVELLRAGEEAAHPALSGLGPDVLVSPVDLDEVRRRASTRPPDRPIGELLLDQGVVSGIGNIWRCETLFACRRDPWHPYGSLDAAAFDELITTASRLMTAAVEPGRGFRRDFGRGPDRPWVYDRAGRPCVRCRTPVSVTPMGSDARNVYWCRSCQGPSSK